jgi:hypothetical protein
MIKFPKKEILMDYIIRLCDFLMGKNAENSKKIQKISNKPGKCKYNPGNSRKYPENPEKSQKFSNKFK